jgi:hypothetical protein
MSIILSDTIKPIVLNAVTKNDDMLNVVTKNVITQNDVKLNVECRYSE